MVTYKYCVGDIIKSDHSEKLFLIVHVETDLDYYDYLTLELSTGRLRILFADSVDKYWSRVE